MTSKSGEQLLNRLLSTNVKGELLVLFNKNPWLIDTAEGIARRIGRDETAIEGDLNDLKVIGILEQKQIGGLQTMYMNREKMAELQDLIATYFTTFRK